MNKLETEINNVLRQLKTELADETWKSRRRYFNQMLKLSELLNITEPCQKLYDAFISDDSGSKERRSLHIRCVRLLDAAVGTKAKDENGIFYNDQPMPNESEVLEYFHDQRYPLINTVSLDFLIVKSEIEMRYLKLSDSTMGQYRQSWMDIYRYFIENKTSFYDEALIRRFLNELNEKRTEASIKEWKWKINRKAAHVLMEVATTGRFNWGMLNRSVGCTDAEIESIRSDYLSSLAQRNLSQSTISLYDYVFRKAVTFAGIKSKNDLLSLSPQTIQLVTTKLSSICNKRSMATLLPILRLLLKSLHLTNLIEKDLSGIVMGSFVQRGSVAAYISENDLSKLMVQIDKESKRTKAVTLLAMKLGLRDCDICNLTFQEIDWQNDELRLTQKKTGEPLILPLLPDVGNALMDYILDERPKRADHYPYVFLRKQAPYNKLSSVYLTCSKLLEEQKINPINGTSTGVHLFRYTLVHRLLVAKIPYQVITDVLGHGSKESDKPYLSMDESMLRMCALDLSVIGKISWRGDTSND